TSGPASACSRPRTASPTTFRRTGPPHRTNPSRPLAFSPRNASARTPQKRTHARAAPFTLLGEPTMSVQLRTSERPRAALRLLFGALAVALVVTVLATGPATNSSTGTP